ncbi:MAG: hypothetical protein ACKOQ6_12410 [Bacteroidota bacterium]
MESEASALIPDRRGARGMEPKKSKYEQIPVAPGPDGLRDFEKMLHNHDIDPDLAAEIAGQIKEAENQEVHNVIFVFTEGNYAVTGIHVPAESINGSTGPVIMMGSNEKHLIAAFSRENITELLTKVDVLEEGAGLPGVAEQAWINELEKLVERVRVEMKNNPPENWVEKLGN